jgi:hypothetical protein
MPEGEQTERRVSLRSEEHRWVNVLKEEQDSMSMAVLLKESLESKRSHSRRCGKTDQRTVLETAICINESIGKGMQLVKAHAQSEPLSWRDPDRIWNLIWDVRHVPKGMPFWMACGSRMMTVRPLTNTHLLLEWDLVKREVFRSALGMNPGERRGHWEQIEDRSKEDVTRPEVADAIRPVPVHIC